ncbi:hypothetical protein [Brevibacillus borstelensis]|uniref:hypothetical protein n=1 Tax=Brevibacillus borstelensis TaxID=45462 RepID=UPI0030BCD913
MFQHVSRFVSQFRELEKKDLVRTNEEERRLEELKEKLTSLQAEEPRRQNRRCIAVLSLYPQAGASFLAGNVAYAMAGSGTNVTLCELPGTNSYLYFALDFERRADQPAQTQLSSTLYMQNDCLRIHVDTPLKNKNSSHEAADLLFRLSKESSTVLIDISSSWKDRQMDRLLEMIDEIWVVFDSDIARLTRMILTEKPPSWWFGNYSKIRMIANKWNEKWNRSAIMKKVSGTLSLWNEGHAAFVSAVIPLFDGDKTFAAHSKAMLLLEQYPDEETCFSSLLHEKGRGL